MSPGGRFSLVLALIATLHAGGALASRTSPGLSATLHAVGTAAFGAGIYLAGQIFHMAEHWPSALMLWSVGAAVGVVLLRQWPQVLWLAVLAPAWLWGEWTAAQPPHAVWRGLTPVAVGMFLLACAYLMATARGLDRALASRARLARRDRADPGRHCACDVERRRLDDVRRRVPGGDRRAAHRRLDGRHRAAARRSRRSCAGARPPGCWRRSPGRSC